MKFEISPATHISGSFLLDQFFGETIELGDADDARQLLGIAEFVASRDFTVAITAPRGKKMRERNNFSK